MRFSLLAFFGVCPLVSAHGWVGKVKSNNGLPSINSTCTAGTKVSWTHCPPDETFDYGDGAPIECGVLAVPFDYNNCSAGMGELYVIRLNATVSPKLGPLFVNPGED